MVARKMNAASVIKHELTPLGQGRMLQDDPTEVALVDTVTSYAILNHLEKLIQGRKAQLKPHLMSQAETHGTRTDKGGSSLQVEEEEVLRERRVSAGPNEDGLRTLLETHSISLLECFDEVKTVKLNPSKLQYLIDIGKLQKNEVDGLHDESFALQVKVGRTLKELLRIACGAVEEETDERASRTTRKPRR